MIICKINKVFRFKSDREKNHFQKPEGRKKEKSELGQMWSFIQFVEIEAKICGGQGIITKLNQHDDGEQKRAEESNRPCSLIIN